MWTDRGEAIVEQAGLMAPGLHFIEEGETRVLAGVRIEAGSISVAGQETCIVLPDYKVALDTGRCPQRAVYQPNVLLTHAHMDHIGGLPAQLSSRNLHKLPPTRVFLPPCLVAPTEALLAAYRVLDASSMNCTLQPIEVGQRQPLGNRDVHVTPFATTHTVPSQGYVISRTRRKLRQDLAGLSNADIAARAKAGEAVSTEVEVPEVAFTGDTDSRFLEAAVSAPAAEAPTPASQPDRGALQSALSARLLILEMTFLCDEVTDAHAREFGHMHLRDFVRHADKFKNEAILLIHFSARYSKARILELLGQGLPEGLRERCTALLVGYR